MSLFAMPLQGCQQPGKQAQKSELLSLCPYRLYLAKFLVEWDSVLLRRSWSDKACNNLWKFTIREDKPLRTDKNRHLILWILNRHKSLFLAETPRSLHRGVVLIHHLWGVWYQHMKKYFKSYGKKLALFYHISCLWLKPMSQNYTFTPFWLFHICGNRN